MSNVMLSAQNINFAWGKHSILNDFSLDVEKGSIVCLMGLNGCGKSTFLDCVIGENPISSGNIFIDGNKASSLKPRDRARYVSYVPQFHERVFPFTVKHVVLMGRTAYRSGVGVLQDSDEKIALDALRMCGMEKFANRICTELSGGEMQMVLLARAITQQAPLMVLDEPTAHLDFRNEIVFIESVKRMASQHGTSVLMATHNPNQAFYLESLGLNVQVAVMTQGRVVAKGTPEEVVTPEVLRDYFGVRSVRTQVTFDSNIVQESIEKQASLDTALQNCDETCTDLFGVSKEESSYIGNRDVTDDYSLVPNVRRSDDASLRNNTSISQIVPLGTVKRVEGNEYGKE